MVIMETNASPKPHFPSMEIHTSKSLQTGNVILVKMDMNYKCDSELRLEMVY
jgi:hypothetical protein